MVAQTTNYMQSLRGLHSLVVNSLIHSYPQLASQLGDYYSLFTFVAILSVFRFGMDYNHPFYASLGSMSDNKYVQILLRNAYLLVFEAVTDFGLRKVRTLLFIVYCLNIYICVVCAILWPTLFSSSHVPPTRTCTHWQVSKKILKINISKLGRNSTVYNYRTRFLFAVFLLNALLDVYFSLMDAGKYFDLFYSWYSTTGSSISSRTLYLFLHLPLPPSFGGDTLYKYL